MREGEKKKCGTLSSFSVYLQVHCSMVLCAQNAGVYPKTYSLLQLTVAYAYTAARPSETQKTIVEFCVFVHCAHTFPHFIRHTHTSPYSGNFSV